MADLNQALTFVLGEEDAPGAGTITRDSDGLTRYGLLNRYHPGLTEAGFYAGSPSPGKEDVLEPTMENAEALGLARAEYQKNEWAAIEGGRISSQAIATALLSFAVNDGARQAVALLQQALGFTSDRTDGVMGPVTLAAVNAADPAALLRTFAQRQQGFYLHVESVNPAKRVDGNGWRNRVKAVEALAV